MSPSQSLETSLWAAMILQTLGAVDAPGSGPRKLPAPRAYAAIFIVWTVLGFVADSSAAAARAARTAAWVTVLATLVLGGAGQRLASFLQNVAGLYAPPSAVPPARAPSSGPVTQTTTTLYT